MNREFHPRIEQAFEQLRTFVVRRVGLLNAFGMPPQHIREVAREEVDGCAAPQPDLPLQSRALSQAASDPPMPSLTIRSASEIGVQPSSSRVRLLSNTAFCVRDSQSE